MTEQQSHQLIYTYQHEGIIVVDKPSGLASQPTRKGEENLFDLLKKKHKYIALHHRLDRPASGLLLLCTDRRCNAEIAKSFQNRSITRKYRAIVLGNSPDCGEWTYPIDGKPAHSIFKTIEQYDGFALIEVELKTGRTHQIRRHAQVAGRPILGDRKYGGAAGRLWTRLCLHAAELRFIHPHSKETIICRSEMPKSMADACEKFK